MNCAVHRTFGIWVICGPRDPGLGGSGALQYKNLFFFFYFLLVYCDVGPSFCFQGVGFRVVLYDVSIKKTLFLQISRSTDTDTSSFCIHWITFFYCSRGQTEIVKCGYHVSKLKSLHDVEQ